MIENIPLDADHSSTMADTIVIERLSSVTISSIYNSKKALTAEGVKSFPRAENSSDEAPSCIASDINSIISGISERNIKNAVCAEKAPILLAFAFLIKYLMLFINPFNMVTPKCITIDLQGEM